MLEDIKSRIEKLIARYEAVRAENERLHAELETCKAENDSYRKQMTELGQEIDTLKLTEAFMAGGNTPSIAKERIDKIIKEIDRCISLLEV